MTDLASRLDAVVRAVPGVVTLFSASPAIVGTVRQLTAGEDAVALVQVKSGTEGLQIIASVGVSGQDQAPRTAAAVSSAIRAALDAGVVAEVHVRVSRVHG